MVRDRFEEVLADLLRRRATAGVEVREDPKRWQFFVQDGALVASRSNLKSEQPQSLEQKMGKLADREMARVQVGLRLKNVLKSNATWEVFEGSTSSTLNPAPVYPALVEAVAEVRDEATLREALGEVLAGRPRLRADAPALGLPERLATFLNKLDGKQAGDEAVGRWAGEPTLVLAAFWLAWRMEALELVAEAGPAADLSDISLDEDIGALLAAQVARETGKPSAPASAPQRDPREDRLNHIARRIDTADNYFQFFGLTHEAPADRIRSAYMEMTKDLHPDRYTDAPPEMQERSTELFDRVRQAWETLQNDTERQKYIDRVIHKKATEEEVAMQKVQNYWAAEADFKKGLAAYNNGRVAQAFPFFKSAVEKSPDELEFLVYYGYALFTVNRTKNPELSMEGVKLIQQVLEANAAQERKLDQGWVLLGRAWRDLNDKAEAKRCFKRAFEINSANGDAARLYRRTKDELEQEEQGSGFFKRMFNKKK